jgi:hypothetical protein
MSAAINADVVENVKIAKADDLKEPCAICKEAPSIYKCPRCSILTCSLTCCKKHKVDVSHSYANYRSRSASFLNIRHFLLTITIVPV